MKLFAFVALLSVSAAAQVTLAPAALPNGTVGVAYNQSESFVLSGPGGVIPAVFFVTQGVLPPGLNPPTLLNDWRITGTPTTSGTFSFTVTGTETANPVAVVPKIYSLVISAPPSISTTVIPSAVAGVTYATGNPLVTLQATGGAPPYTFERASGTFPNGLDLNPSGAIIGTAQTIGSSALTFRVRDAAGATAVSAPLQVNVVTGLSVTTAALPGSTVARAYTAAAPLTTLLAAGGIAPYTWSSNAINGLSVTPAGLVTGTPTTAGSFTLRVQVTDAAANTVSKDLPFTTALTAGATLTLSSTNPTAGQQPSVTVNLGTAASSAVTGTLTITFAPASGLVDDPLIRFSGGTRTQAFTIAQGATQSNAVQFATGTVAGVITIRATLTNAGGVDITPTPAPSSTITITPAPPVVSGVRITSVTGGYNIAVTGFSVLRDVQTITFHFVPTSGTTLTQADIPVDVRTAFTTWYAGATSQTFGSQFTVTVPFTFTGSTFPVVALTVDMTSAQGTSSRFGPVNP